MQTPWRSEQRQLLPFKVQLDPPSQQHRLSHRPIWGPGFERESDAQNGKGQGCVAAAGPVTQLIAQLHQLLRVQHEYSYY